MKPDDDEFRNEFTTQNHESGGLGLGWRLLRSCLFTILVVIGIVFCLLMTCMILLHP